MTAKSIIIHCSATKDSGTVSTSAIRHYHKEVMGWSDIGYHFLVELCNENDYEVLIGRPWDQEGAHCYGHNKNSLGICIIGDFDIQAPPEGQWKKSVDFVAFLCYYFGIPVDYIYGHRHFDSHKTCPGKAFDMDRFRNDVKIELKKKVCVIKEDEV